MASSYSIASGSDTISLGSFADTYVAIQLVGNASVDADVTVKLQHSSDGVNYIDLADTTKTVLSGGSDVYIETYDYTLNELFLNIDVGSATLGTLDWFISSKKKENSGEVDATISGTVSTTISGTVNPNNYWINRAIANISDLYGDTVSVVDKNKTLIKFGRNSNLSTTRSTIWEIGGNETYPTGNNIDVVVSTSASDTQEVVIEGHTLSGSDLTFVSQTATLNGTTNVSLSTPLYRANRMYNNGSTDFVGTVTVKDNGTSDHLTALPTQNQSLKCATSLSSQDYWIITDVDIGVGRQQTRSVDFQLQIREFGKVWRTLYYSSCHSNSGSIIISLTPCLIAPKNSDIRVVGISSGASTSCSASIHGVLAIIV